MSNHPVVKSSDEIPSCFCYSALAKWLIQLWAPWVKKGKILYIHFFVFVTKRLLVNVTSWLFGSWIVILQQFDLKSAKSRVLSKSYLLMDVKGKIIWWMTVSETSLSFIFRLSLWVLFSVCLSQLYSQLYSRQSTRDNYAPKAS